MRPNHRLLSSFGPGRRVIGFKAKVRCDARRNRMNAGWCRLLAPPNIAISQHNEPVYMVFQSRLCIGTDTTGNTTGKYAF